MTLFCFCLEPIPMLSAELSTLSFAHLPCGCVVNIRPSLETFSRLGSG
jgi:hypothetical protein